MYSYVHPKIWNRLKFNLRKCDTLIYKGDIKDIPSYVTKFADALGISLIPFDDFDYDAKWDELDMNSLIFSQPSKEVEEDEEKFKEFVADILWDEMFSTSWEEIEDYPTFYVEANARNLCTTIGMFREFVKKDYPRIWQSLGYNIKMLLWEDMVAELSQIQINYISALKDFEIEIAKWDNENPFPYERVSLAENAIDSFDSKKICHVISSGYEVNAVYRRVHLNKALKEKYDEENVATNVFLGSYEKVIVSHPTDIIPIGQEIIYDRSDNWLGASGSNHDETVVMKVANKITCSSQWLYRDTLNWLKENRPLDKVEVTYIPNGNEEFDFVETEKFETPTAIYIGQNLEKVDMTILYLLCDMHPNWNFLIYANNATQLRSIPSNMTVHETIPMKDLFEVLCKCHLGLIPMISSAWTQGMLSNKLFAYINAHIPTVYCGVPSINYQDYSEVSFELQTLSSLDDVLDKNISADTFEKYKRSWNEVTSEIIGIIGD